MSDPKISVLMSVYNTPEEWLRNAIESILSQTFDDFEFVIVLDKPTDNSAEVVKEYATKDERVIVLENDENLGLTKNLNKGLAIARGKYIARMDSDDVAFCHRFEKQYRYMEAHPEVVALGTQVCTSLDPDHAMDKFPVSDWTPDQDVLKIRMLFHTVGLPHPTSMFRHDVMIQHGITYDERIKKSQDYKLWVDLMPYGDISMLNEVLLMYRVHEGQISTNRKNQYQYAHMVAVEQAEKLLGPLTENERAFHECFASMDIHNDDVKGYKRYVNRLIQANDSKGIYNKDKFHREMNYAWAQKAFRRALKMKRLDMLASAKSFRMLSPTMTSYLKENKEVKAQRKIAVENADFTDCVLR